MCRRLRFPRALAPPPQVFSMEKYHLARICKEIKKYGLIFSLDHQMTYQDTGMGLAEVGERIRSLRQKREMTLQQLSDQAGVSVGMLSQMERGRSSPTIRTLQRVADALEVPLNWFFSLPEVSQHHPHWVLPHSHRRK